MSRHAQMLALFQLLSLVFLLVVQLSTAAPLLESSNIILLDSDDVDEVFSTEEVAAHTAPPGEDKTTKSEDQDDVTKKDVDKPEDSVVPKSEDQAGMTKKDMDKPEDSISEDQDGDGESKENVDKHEDSAIIKTEDDGNSLEGPEENVNKLTKTEDDTTAAEEENLGQLENSAVTSSGADGKTAKTNVEKHEDNASSKTEEDTEEKAEKQKGHTDKINGSTTGQDAGSSGENMSSVAVQVGHGQNSNEKSETAVVRDDSDESEEFVEDDKKADEEAGESTSLQEGFQENKETEWAVLEEEDVSEEEVSEENNKDIKHGAALGNSSEVTSDVEDNLKDIEVDENHSNKIQEDTDMTSSPFAQLRAPPSDSQNDKKEDEHNNKDVALEGHSNNYSLSIEETAEKEPGSPDDLIEDDRVDSEVIGSDNNTAAMGRSMPLAGDEDADKKDKSDNTGTSPEDIKKDSLVPLVSKESEHGEKISIEQEATSSENEDEKVESAVDEVPKNKHDSEPKEAILNGKPLDEETNEKDNFLDKDDEHSKDPLNQSDGEIKGDKEDLGIVENGSEDEGSGSAAGIMEWEPHSETDNQHEAVHVEEEAKEGNKVIYGEEETKASSGFDSSIGHEEEANEHDHKGVQENNSTEDVEDGPGSGFDEDDSIPIEHTTESFAYSIAHHIPILGDNEETSVEYHSESTIPEDETSTVVSDYHLPQNKTNVQVMSVDKGNDDHIYDGSGDEDTTTPVPIISDTNDEALVNIVRNIDNSATSSKEIDLTNSSVVGGASHAYREKPVERVFSPQLEAASSPVATETPCIADEYNEDCLLQSNKSHEVTSILKDELLPEPTSADAHSKSASDVDMKELEAIISTTPEVRVHHEEESLYPFIAVDLNEPSSSTVVAPIQEITEPVEDVDSTAVINDGAPDSIVEHSPGETGVREKSGEMRVANVNELGVSGQEIADDLGEPEALDSSNASGSYIVLGCIMAVVVVLLAYAAIKSRRERGANTSSKKQSELAGDDDDGTELKDMKKALLPPETQCEDQNGDIEANRKPLMDKVNSQDEVEEKEPIVKQNGNLELSEPPRDIVSQVDSSSNKPQQRNGLSEIVVERPAVTNGKADSIITHPVAAKVKVIENEDSIAKTPVFINRGGSSPLH